MAFAAVLVVAIVATIIYIVDLVVVIKAFWCFVLAMGLIGLLSFILSPFWLGVSPDQED